MVGLDVLFGGYIPEIDKNEIYSIHITLYVLRCLLKKRYDTKLIGDDITNYTNAVESINDYSNTTLLYNIVDDLTNNLLIDFITIGSIKLLNKTFNTDRIKQFFIKVIALISENHENKEKNLLTITLVDSNIPIKNNKHNFKKKVKLLHFNCTEKMPQILEYNILFTEPKYINYNNNNIFISKF
jgi:hypothetical protein